MSDTEVRSTRAILRRMDALAAARTCPWCGALPGEPCRVRSTGRPTAYGNHARRDADLWAAYRLGRQRERMAHTRG